MKKLFLLGSLLFILSSCTLFTKVILNVGGQLSSVEKPVLDSLNHHKQIAENIGLRVRELYKPENTEYKEVKLLYDSLKTEHNSLTLNLSNKIKKGKEIKFEDFKPEFEKIKTKSDKLNKKWIALSSGFNEGELMKIIAEAGIEILKILGKQMILNEYSRLFYDKYSISDFEKIPMDN